MDVRAEGEVPARAHVAVVLAAGGSRRLGRPKQLLRRAGETLVHRMARLAIASGAQRVLVVIGADESIMRAALADIDVDVVFNPDWTSGLASSVRAAAVALATDETRVLMIACDQPALELDHLHRLLHAAASTSSGCAATAHQGRPGIPAVVSADLLRTAGLAADRGLAAALGMLPAPSIALLDAMELCRDIDNADDLQAAVAVGLIDAPS